MNKGVRFCLLASTSLLLIAGEAVAQYAPPPQKSPRTPVSKQVLHSKDASALPPSRILEGHATILDTDRLKIDDVEMRLFGVVPPQLRASFGPQARATVEALAQGTVTCRIKDREKSGVYLATCHDAAGTDFGLDLLRRGLAASARGTLQSSDYAKPYFTAEAAAQSQRLGLWSIALPAPVSDKAIRDTALKAEQDKIAAQKAAEELAAKQAAEDAAQKATPQATPNEAATAASTEEASAETPDISAPAPRLETAPPEAAVTQNLAPPIFTSSAPVEQPLPAQSIMEKYQLLLTGLLVLLAALSVTAGVIFYKLRQNRNEISAIAAALRGELASAKSICQARLARIDAEGTDKAVSWPRLRVMVFQAYVGRIGLLGAEIARQVASIYGSASDYSSYFSTSGVTTESDAKRRALETLVHHIDDISPRLAHVEKTGCIQKAKAPLPPERQALKAPPKVLSLTPPPLPREEAVATEPPAPSINESDIETAQESNDGMSTSLSQVKAEIVADAVPAPQPTTEVKASSAASKHAKPKAKQDVSKTAFSTLAKSTGSPLKKEAPAPRHAQPTAKESLATKVSQKLQDMTQTALQSARQVNVKDKLASHLEKMKKLATTTKEKATARKPETTNDSDISIPDYANLTEDELEALLYAEEEMLLATPAKKSERSA